MVKLYHILIQLSIDKSKNIISWYITYIIHILYEDYWFCIFYIGILKSITKNYCGGGK